MQVLDIQPQAGPPAGGFVADQIRNGIQDARAAMNLAATDWTRKPLKPGPHPREAAIAAAREATIHLNEALRVEAPEDAIEETRHALAELGAVIDELATLPNDAEPTLVPIARFEGAITLLERIETRLREANWGYG